MPEYLTPGVYVEEFEIGAKPIEGVSTSTAGFLGETERGPTTPQLITSWLQYQRVFGGFFGADKYLPYAVQGFFDNGGQRCFIARVVNGVAAAPDTPAVNPALEVSGRAGSAPLRRRTAAGPPAARQPGRRCPRSSCRPGTMPAPWPPG